MYIFIQTSVRLWLHELWKKAWNALKNSVNKVYAGLRVGRLDLG